MKSLRDPTKNKVIMVRLTEKDYERLEKMAKRHDIPPSTMLRHIFRTSRAR